MIDSLVVMAEMRDEIRSPVAEWWMKPLEWISRERIAAPQVMTFLLMQTTTGQKQLVVVCYDEKMHESFVSVIRMAMVALIIASMQASGKRMMLSLVISAASTDGRASGRIDCHHQQRVHLGRAALMTAAVRVH